MLSHLQKTHPEDLRMTIKMMQVNKNKKLKSLMWNMKVVVPLSKRL